MLCYCPQSINSKHKLCLGVPPGHACLSILDITLKPLKALFVILNKAHSVNGEYVAVSNINSLR